MRHPISGREIKTGGLEALEGVAAIEDIGPRELCASLASTLQQTIENLVTWRVSSNCSKWEGVERRILAMTDVLEQLVDVEAVKLERRTAIALEGSVQIAEKEQR